MRKADLVRALEAVPDFEDPDPAAEQYRTPGAIAADLLWAARDDGDIEGRDVVDLGCGTGVFALGAAMLGARGVVGVERDASACRITRGTLAAFQAQVVEVDVADWSGRADTVVMNPPFGAQRRGADRPFLRAAVAATQDAPGGAIWFLQQPRNEAFLTRWFSDQGLEVERVLRWDYPIEARFGFHDRDVARVDVAGYRANRPAA